MPWLQRSIHWLETGSEIPDRYTDSLLTYEPERSNGSIYGQILNRSWEILPVERKLKEPLWFTKLLPSTR